MASDQHLTLAVVGAHLRGQPLNHQLTDLAAEFSDATTTSASYRLFALPDCQPPKPGLVRVSEGGVAIAIERWSVPMANVGAFIRQVPSPLVIGQLECADGAWVHGFLAEPYGLEGATDISAWGGWLAWRANPASP